METAYSHLSEYELLQMLKSGSEAAYKEIYDRYWGLLFVHAYKILRSEEEARDILQELFIHLWKRRHSLAEIDSLSSYLYTSVRNRVINELSRQKNNQRLLESFQYHSSSNYSPVLERIQEKQLAEIIENEYKHLPEKMRIVFELSRKQALSHKEIGRILNISDKTVKKQVANALKLIKVRLPYFYLFMLTRDFFYFFNKE